MDLKHRDADSELAPMGCLSLYLDYFCRVPLSHFGLPSPLAFWSGQFGDGGGGVGEGRTYSIHGSCLNIQDSSSHPSDSSHI